MFLQTSFCWSWLNYYGNMTTMGLLWSIMEKASYGGEGEMVLLFLSFMHIILHNVLAKNVLNQRIGETIILIVYLLGDIMY